MVATRGGVVAVLAISDSLKPDTQGVVAALAKRGLALLRLPETTVDTFI